MPQNIEQLIGCLKTEPGKRDFVLSQLVSMGSEAVSEIVAALKIDPKLSRSLGQVLFMLEGNDMVSVFQNLFEQKSFQLASLGAKGLVWQKDDRVLEHFITALSGKRKLLAIQSLGELGNKEAVPHLLQIIDTWQPRSIILLSQQTDEIEEIEELDETALHIINAAICALAKLGNFEFSFLLPSLLTYRCQDPYSDAPVIRANAAHTLQWLILPDMLDLLQTALNDAYFEVRVEAVDAAFYLGLPQVVPLLIARMEDENGQVKNNAIVHLQTLLSTRLETKTEMAHYWQSVHKFYQRDICYRNGEPINISTLFLELKNARFRSPILQEIQVITGVDFGIGLEEAVLPTENLIVRTQNWWSHHQADYELGKIYKCGVAQNKRLVL